MRPKIHETNLLEIRFRPDNFNNDNDEDKNHNDTVVCSQNTMAIMHFFIINEQRKKVHKC